EPPATMGAATSRRRPGGGHTRGPTREAPPNRAESQEAAWLLGWRAAEDGGGGGNRTHVPRRPVLGLYARSPSIGVTAIAPADRIGRGQPDSFSPRTGRAAVSRPACCVSPRPPAGVGISASLPSFQLGSESEVLVGTSVFRRDLRGPRT